MSLSCEPARIRPDYQHDPIDYTEKQIRLIRLYKELSEDGLIQCEVRIFDSSEEIQYRAISYVWGPETPNRAIIINEARYIVRENLWQFLYIFRLRRDNDSPIWIDQISIDQQNLSERNHQVQLMGTIFGNAFEVTAWLGWPKDARISVRTALQRHKESPRVSSRREEFPVMFSHGWKDCLTAFCPICDYHRDEAENSQAMNESWSAYVDSPYWTRLWIIQEIVLAKSLVFVWGQDRLSPADLEQYYSYFSHGGQDIVMTHAVSLLELRNTLLEDTDNEGLTLNQVLETICPADSRCADARDFVFGILGMVRVSDRIPVDYGLTTEKLCESLLDRTIFLSDRSRPDTSYLSNLGSMIDKLGLSTRWKLWLSRFTDLQTSGPFWHNGILEHFLDSLQDLEWGGLKRSQWPVHVLGSIVSVAMEHAEFLAKRNSMRCVRPQYIRPGWGIEPGLKTWSGLYSRPAFNTGPGWLMKRLIKGLESMAVLIESSIPADQRDYLDEHLHRIEEIMGHTSSELNSLVLSDGMEASDDEMRPFSWTA